MPRTIPEQPRPLTRSMTSSTIRRSVRLRSSNRKPRDPESSLEPASLSGSAEQNVRRRPERHGRSSLTEHGSRRSNSRRKGGCGQSEIDVPTARRLRHPESRESTVVRGPSIRPMKTCNRDLSRVKELEGQLDTALQAEKELVAKVKEHRNDLAQVTLKHLEEYFTCPLCFEIMACPYTLSPRDCGHTFCATCILKWFFSRLHKGCGGWHEAVDCPLCRSPLPLTPERTPRSISCFPFTPNRTADVAIRGFINTISHDVAVTSALTTPLSDWNEGGHGKREWCKRDRTGRIEMTAIAAQWSTLKPTDFVSIKNRLEV